MAYIATFFSVITNAETDGCIYALDLSKIDEMNKKALCNETLKSFINNKAIEDYAINVIQPMTNFITRLNAQNGCFTVAPDGLSIDDWISCFEKYKDRKVLRKIVIQGSIKKELLDFLETVNINYSTIYPDLQGISLHCNYKLSVFEDNAKSNLMMQKLFEKSKNSIKETKCKKEVQ